MHIQHKLLAKNQGLRKDAITNTKPYQHNDKHNDKRNSNHAIIERP